MSKLEINYAANLAEHPLIAEHPLYKSLLSCSLDKFYLKEDGNANNLSLIPTYYKYLSNNPHAIIIEDYITLFFPHIHNGSNYQIDVLSQPWLKSYKEIFNKDVFRGVICHMQQTLSSLVTIFGESILPKLFYVPLATEEKIAEIKPTNPDRIVLTITNSFGGLENNFYLRGSDQVIKVFKSLIDKGTNNLFLNIVGVVPPDYAHLDFITTSNKVRLHRGDIVHRGRRMLSDKEYQNIMLDTDIFLIPSCRIHSMSVVNSMSYGCMVVGSNGWGFNEFLPPEVLCRGQQKSSYIENNLLKEAYTYTIKDKNQELEESLYTLLDNITSSQIDLFKQQNLQLVKTKYTKKAQAVALEKALEKMVVYD